MLRLHLEDMTELYNAARLNEDAPRMEKLSKVISELANKIVTHEANERETLRREEAQVILAEVCKVMAEVIRKMITKEESADILINAVVKHGREKFTAMWEPAQ